MLYRLTVVITVVYVAFGINYDSQNSGNNSSEIRHNYTFKSNPYEKPHRLRDHNYTGDARCKGDYIRLSESHREFEVQARYRTLKVRYVYLCDGPDIEYHKRPEFARSYSPPSKSHRNVSVSLGIPYAKPPIKELRFKPPERPIPPFVRHVWGYRPACPQIFNKEAQEDGIEEIDEDCLYLNVFSPFAGSRLSKLYPVMVYLHGGLWENGNAENFPAHMLAASQEVVVVTFNYRLGPLGFLSTGDKVSPGNYGLLDQSMAINWVYENIRAFNGDPEMITLFGSGAGAASVGLYMLSQYRNSAVWRVIAQSGSAVAGWAAIDDTAFVQNNTAVYGLALGCDTRSSENLVKCLVSRSYEELTSIRIKREVGWVTWAPVIDRYYGNVRGPYLKDLPETILKRGDFEKDFIYMSGVTRDEGAWILLKDKDLKKQQYEVDEEYFRNRAKKYIKIYNYTETPASLQNAIEFLYKPWSNPTNQTMMRQGVVDMLSDSYFVAPNDKMVKLMIKSGIPTYMYVLNYTIEGIESPKWQAIPHEIENLLITGAPFMDPRFYPRSLSLGNVTWTEADRNMSRFFMEAWGNFAKHGNPTPQRILNAILWELMEEKHQKYLSINSTNVTSFMCKDYRQTESYFWNLYIPKLVEKITPTWAPTFEPLLQEVRIYESSLWGVVAGAGLFLITSVLFFGLFCHSRRKRHIDDV